MHTSQFSHFKFSFNKELKEIYISIMIRALALSLIAVFIPIYLFKDLGYSVERIVSFYTLFFLVFALFSPLSAKLVSRIGFKHSMYISTFLSIFGFVILNILKIYSSILTFFSVPLILGIASSLYWISFHIDLAKYTKKKYRGEQIAGWQLLASITALIGPTVSGLILSYFSFSILFIIGSIILIISTIPLFLSKDQHIKSNFSYSQILKGNRFGEFAALSTVGIKEVAQAPLWAFFIFFLIEGYLKFGAVIAAINLLTLAFFIIVGKLSDTVKSEKLLSWGAIILLVSSLVIWFINGILQIIAVSAFLALGFLLIDIPMSKKVYEKAKKTDLGGYIVFREVAHNLGKVFLLLIFFIILKVADIELRTAFIIIFIIAALSGIVQFLKFSNVSFGETINKLH